MRSFLKKNFRSIFISAISFVLVASSVNAIGNFYYDIPTRKFSTPSFVDVGGGRSVNSDITELKSANDLNFISEKNILLTLDSDSNVANEFFRVKVGNNNMVDVVANGTAKLSGEVSVGGVISFNSAVKIIESSGDIAITNNAGVLTGANVGSLIVSSTPSNYFSNAQQQGIFSQGGLRADGGILVGGSSLGTYKMNVTGNINTSQLCIAGSCWTAFPDTNSTLPTILKDVAIIDGAATVGRTVLGASSTKIKAAPFSPSEIAYIGHSIPSSAEINPGVLTNAQFSSSANIARNKLAVCDKVEVHSIYDTSGSGGTSADCSSQCSSAATIVAGPGYLGRGYDYSDNIGDYCVCYYRWSVCTN